MQPTSGERRQRLAWLPLCAPIAEILIPLDVLEPRVFAKQLLERLLVPDCPTVTPDGLRFFVFFRAFFCGKRRCILRGTDAQPKGEDMRQYPQLRNAGEKVLGNRMSG